MSTEEDVGPRRPLWVNLTLLGSAVVVFVIMVLLGNWQMQRLTWKLDLIETVEARAFGVAQAAPVSPPEPDDFDYARVFVTGTFGYEGEVRVKALTELGGGSWLLTPLVVNETRVVWVNRGFVPPGNIVIDRPEGVQKVTGLVRQSEPGGTLLEDNRPDIDRWVSRDLEMMSAERGLSAEPYFIDAEHMGDPAGWPRGGLTKVDFRNDHLSYALTWYAMAALFFGAMIYVVRDLIGGR